MKDRLPLKLNPDQPLVMGILNVTPDSFSDGGQFNAAKAAIIHADLMIKNGAKLIDVGGESTRPGAVEVDAEEELKRVIPVLEQLRELPVVLSIDSYKARVAKQACELGVQVVNDVWGLQRDAAMADVVADAEAHVVMMHNRLEVDPDIDIVSDVKRGFEASIAKADRAGIPKEKQILDPGFGFGKTLEQNYRVLACFEEFQSFERPLLVGASRKSMIGRVLNNEPEERLAGSLAVHSLALQKGADIVRAHDVKEHVEICEIIAAYRKWGQSN
ncbi:dihydropteroate synthase [Polycladidibacter stylochi]|uniref:dihydropteroate synthase n=1 Tax=Polycladidibacter stylochi TaxID=1807766 RepID=UPI000B05C5A8|nr:dihydropteroate synthase [Pseudovibrio stylochi]